MSLDTLGLATALLAARAAAMATAEQWRSLCRQAMPVGEACAQCVCPSWRWRCTMQRFKLSAETPSAAQSFFCASHVRFPDVSKTPLEAWEQFGPAWYGTARGGPLRQRRSKTKKTYPTSIASRVSRADDHNQRKDHHQGPSAREPGVETPTSDVVLPPPPPRTP